MIRKKAWCVPFLGLLALAPAGCQSYAFEELPNSIIKEKRWTQTISISSAADILFVVDNSGSMVGEQKQLAESFQAFASTLTENFGDQFHIAVITTGMESPGCPPCNQTITGSCMNETGENGRFQDRLGKNEGTVDMPSYTFRTDINCRVIAADEGNVDSCFYNEVTEEGTVLVGVNGCGYERGLAPIRVALDDLEGSYNAGFLRRDATLAIVVVSDEEDCGEVGDVSEGVPGAMGDICYYAAKGVGPEGETVHPQDPDAKPYRLTPVGDYYDFLLDLKGGREGMVKFAAIVGVDDVDDLSTTTIEYVQSGGRWDIEHACTTAGCTGDYCFAEPGTRYVKLAQLFGIGQDGFVDTICQNDFSETMEKLGTFVACPEKFLLSEPILDPDLASILINGTPVPRFSCSIPGELVECAGPADASCSQGSCVETWTYEQPTDPPQPNAQGGTISFADHYDPCEFFGEGEQVHIELVYVTPP